jgi:hypothetical protein
MVVNREWAEWQIGLCEDSIKDSAERFSNGFISKEAFDRDVRRLTDQMHAPRLLIDIETGVSIAPIA